MWLILVRRQVESTWLLARLKWHCDHLISRILASAFSRVRCTSQKNTQQSQKIWNTKRDTQHEFDEYLSLYASATMMEISGKYRIR